MQRNGPLRLTSRTCCHAVVGRVDDRRAGLDRGAAHEHVEAAVLLDDRLEHRRDLALVGDVDDGRLGVAARVGDRDRRPRARAVLVDVGDDARWRPPPRAGARSPRRARTPPPVTTATCPRSARSSERRQSAVGRDDRAGRVRREVRREEQRDAGDVVGGAEPVQRDRLLAGRRRSSAGIVSATLRKRGVSIEPGRDHVGAHRRPVLGRDLARQRDEPGLRRRRTRRSPRSR